MRCQAVSWRQVDQLVRELAFSIRASGFRPDIVVAIARGGFVPARLICDFLEVMDLTSFRIEHYHGQQREVCARVRDPLSVNVRGKRVLVVDDLSDTGETFDEATRHLVEHGALEGHTAALHFKLGSKFEPDFYAKKIRKWRWLSYPWARMEDLTGLIEKLESPQLSPDKVSAMLRTRHGLRVPTREVEDALRQLAVTEAGRKGT